MGDPKFPKKKYKTPSHPWQKKRIEEEKVLMKEYGLKNKKEIWKMVSVLRSYHQQAKSLIVSRTAQADKERIQMMGKLVSYGLVDTGAHLDDVLGLTVRNILDRRLQTMLVKRGLASSVKQARHFITHMHVMVGEKIITSPSYLVTSAESTNIRFAPRSVLSDIAHPARAAKSVTPAEVPDHPSTRAKSTPAPKAEAAKAPEKKSEPTKEVKK